MAVTQGVQGLGIGKLLLEHCFAVAKEKEASALILYSNRN
jgi:predicted N-acetyltransferase YhbS